MKICRDYRNFTGPAPFLSMQGDMPAPAVLVIDPASQEVYITIPPEWAETPEGLKIYPWHSCLTVKGIDQALEHPGLLEALRGAVKGNKESEEYLWEVLGSPDFYHGLEVVYPMEPSEYFDQHPFQYVQGESIEDATKRILEEALANGVVLDPLITEIEVEEAICV
jgi:hypothetical protein